MEVRCQLHAATNLPPRRLHTVPFVTAVIAFCHAEETVAKLQRKIVIFPEGSLAPNWNQNCKM
jgi:hypothetical protein